MVAPITASACSFHNAILPSQNYGTKGIKRGTTGIENFNLGQGQGSVMKRAYCGGLQIKANAQNYYGDDKFSRSVNISSIHQNFTIRSYEVDANGKASIETLMNYFQSTVFQHFKKAGATYDVFGSTKEMTKSNLIWVSTQMQFVTYRYPTWDDVVEVEGWLSLAGKNAVRFNWILRDFRTNQVLIRASNVCVMMSKSTRRLSKIPEEIKRGIASIFVNFTPILEDDNTILPKLDDTTADYICSDLTPRWSDIDVNLHVNNVKYIGWVLESIPRSMLMNYELSCLTLRFKRKCRIDSKLQSLAAICSDDINNNNNNVECNHMLRFEDGVEILRGRSKWRPKTAYNFDVSNHVPEAPIDN